MKKMAWHYTTVEKFELILASGVLKTTLSAIDIRTDERPVLWFSTNQYWEPTVQYWDAKSGQTSGIQGTKESGRGLIRLGYPQEKLIPWVDLWRLANINHTTKRSLEKWGKRDGANPYCWMGSFKNIPLEDLILEQMDESNKWKRANHNDFNVLNHEDAERFAWEAGFGRNVYLGLECCIDDIMDEAA